MDVSTNFLNRLKDEIPKGGIIPSKQTREAHREVYEDEDDVPLVLPEPVKTGVFPDVPEGVYHAHPAISRSDMVKYLECDLYLKHALKDKTPWFPEKNEDTKTQRKGRLVHKRILEPKAFKETYSKGGECEASKGNGDPCENPATGVYENEDGERELLCGVHSRGRDPKPIEILTEEEEHMIEGAFDALQENDHTRRYLSTLPGMNELVLVWMHGSGLPLRCRVDRVVYDPAKECYVVVDIKTTDSAHYQDVKRTLGRGPFLQAAFYAMGVEAITGIRTEFEFFFVEREEPFVVQPYTLDDPTDTSARFAVDRTAGKIADSLVNDVWKGYRQEFSNAVNRTTIQRWQKRKWGIET